MDMTENKETENGLREKCAELEAEVQTYRAAAALYGIDPMTMLTLAKSQIKTSANNIRIVEKMQEVLSIFDTIPSDLTEHEVSCAIASYDGDGSKPYCDLVYCGLDIIRKYMKRREEYSKWRKFNLPTAF